MLKRFLEAGQIVGTHGLKGEVRIHPWCNSPDFLLNFDKLYLNEGRDALVCESSRVHKSFVLAKFEEIDDVDGACRLLKKIVYIDRQKINLPKGSYFEQDLIGLSVLDYETGALYGTLTEVGRTGKNDVYTIKGENGRETLIPAIRDVIREVDAEGGKMLITPLKGLFDDED